MNFDLEFHEGILLYKLLSDSRREVVLKTDAGGFLQSAPDALSRLGFDSAGMLIGPHLLDLVEPSFRNEIGTALDAALAGCPREDWTEFRFAGQRRISDWFAIRLESLGGVSSGARGTLGIVRSLGETKALEERLFRAELTDPLTGLTNRPAWVEMMHHLARGAQPAILALVDIDHFKAINHHHGSSTGDRFLVAFADYLRGLTPPEVSLSRVGASRFGILFSGWTTGQTQILCRDIVRVLADLRCNDRQNGFSITASVGIAGVSRDVDETIRAAETALRLSRARGGNTVTTTGEPVACRIEATAE